MDNYQDDAERWKHGIIRTTNKMFRNTDCIFVEYHDCVHLTGLIVLKALQESCKDVFGINMDQISVLDLQGLLLWYIQREHRNFLLDLWDKEEPAPRRMMDEYLQVQYQSNEIHQIPFSSIVVDLILHTMSIGFVKNVVVYAEHVCDGILENVKKTFGDSAAVVGGDLMEVLKDVPADTTYMLSDFEKLITIADSGHLDGAGVLLPSNYRYNYLIAEDGTLQPIVNLEYLSSIHKFSLGFLNLGGM